MRKSVSNYLKIIYEASYTRTGTNNKQIATMLGVLPGSVTEAVSHLEKAGLVTRRTYHEIALTATGYRRVSDLMFRYRLCEVWLAQIIKLPLELVPEQAWLMAAINDRELLERLNQQLQTPTISPFGGRLQLPRYADQCPDGLQSLAAVASGRTVVFESYLETPSTVKYLQHTTLRLQQQFQVVSQEDPLAVITLIDQDQQEYLLNAAVARYIYVQIQGALMPN